MSEPLAQKEASVFVTEGRGGERRRGEGRGLFAIHIFGGWPALSSSFLGAGCESGLVIVICDLYS